MAIKESRDEQYLRILTCGIKDESDYEAFKFLKDKGYAKGDYRISNGRDKHGKVLNAFSNGYTSAGSAYIEELNTRSPPQIISNKASYGESNKIGTKIRQETRWHDTFKGKLVVGVSIGIILFFIKKFLD